MSRILIYDIETSPIISYNWGIWDQNAIEIIEDWQILCFAYKWLGEDKIHIISQDNMPLYEPGVNNDMMVVAKLRDLMDEADVVVGHNSDRFDNKKAQARMMEHGFDPPSPYMQIDTKKVANKYGAFTSNKMAELAKRLEIPQKGTPGGFSTWRGCLEGKPEAWKLMKDYNIQDVVVQEELYLKLRPWIQNHPALNVLDGRPESCPKCLKGPLVKRGTLKINKTSFAQRYKCRNCGGWSQERKNQKTEVSFVN